MATAIPAVAYYRMSSDDQKESIGDQRRAVEEYAALHGFNIIREYSDAGISGWKSDERVEFQRLIADAADGDFKAVLCWDQDRFSRFDPLEANHYWYLLDRAGVRLATVAQGPINWNDLAGWLTASVAQHGKAQYVRDLARNSVRGQRRKRVQERKWTTTPPLGYTRDENLRLVPGDAEDIALVRRIFTMRASGDGYFTIANRLNVEGVPTPRGRRWAPMSIKRIVQRDAYIGTLALGKQSRAKFEPVVAEPLFFENHHEPIIDRDLWERVQELDTMSRQAHTRNGSCGSALGGLLKCGRCGATMYVFGHHGIKYFVCGSYHRDRSCGWCGVNREMIERAVFTKIRQKLLMGSRERLEAAIQKALDRRRPDGEPRCNKRELAKLDRQIEQATERMLLIDADLLPIAQRKLRELTEQRTRLAGRTATKAPQRPLPSAREIANEAWRLDEIMQEASPAAVRHALERVIDHVALDFEEYRPTPKRTRYRCVGGTINLRRLTAQHQA